MRFGFGFSLVLGTLALLVLSGCSSVDLSSSGMWFARPLDVFGRQGGYAYSELQESKQVRPITANDLVAANGACPPPAGPARPQAGAPSPSAPAGPEAESLLGSGIALGMSECDVVYRAGQPTAVRLSNNQNGSRVAVLTFDTGPRPGIYRFEGGRLMQMDRVAQQAAPEPKKLAKKRPVRPVKQQKVSNQS